MGLIAANLMDLSAELDPDGVLSEKDMHHMVNCFLECLGVHIERDRIRRGLWKDYPVRDQVNTIRIKVDRIMRSLEILDALPSGSEEAQGLRDNLMEELPDVVNYAFFAMRLERGQI